MEIEGGTVIYGVHLNSSGLGFCRVDDAIKGARDLEEKATALGLDADAKAIDKAIKSVRSAMKAARAIPALKRRGKKRCAARARARRPRARSPARGGGRQSRQERFVAGDFNTPLQESGRAARSSMKTPAMMGCATKLDAGACKGKDGFDDTYACSPGG